MSGYLLDTNVPSELTRPEPDSNVRRWLSDADDRRLFISVISFGEFRKGQTVLPESKRRRELQDWVDITMRSWFNGRILSIDTSIAEKWGMLAGERQLHGRPLNTTDGLIAATALENDLTLVTRNVKDFMGLGLTILNPWEAN